MADVLGCWPVHLARDSAVIVLQVPADVCDVHVEAQLMPAG